MSSFSGTNLACQPMAQSTLLGWANSVRVTMANDPGRELFQEQVQTHGFSFLDNYLSDILSGAKQDPLIELVKTPGRKKALSRKPKSPTKLAQVVTASLEEPNSRSAQEDSLVVNNFTQALLNAKRGSEAESSPKLSQAIGTTPADGTDSLNAKQDHFPAPTHNQLELSVIAEDDEAKDLSGPSMPEAAEISPSSDTREQAITANVVETQTVPRDETHADRGKHMGSVLPTNTSPVPPVIPNESALNDFNDHSSKIKEESASVDIVVPLRDVEVSPVSPKSIVHKDVLSTLPAPPDPIPFRKSMRSAKDLSFGNIMLGAATPGNTGAGKRTSWLMKAREVKAMEDIPKKLTVTPGPATATVLAGVKRRSDETTNSFDQEGGERLSKAMKTRKEETIPAKIASPKHVVTKPEPSTETLERRSKDEMLDSLKKRVQSFETRTEKPSSMLSGNTAIALAEARAQAEARIAERHQNSAMGDIGSTATASELKAPPITKPSKLEPSSHINDLFPSEGKVKDKSKSPGKDLSFHVFAQASMRMSPNLQEPGNYQSTSTTPPHSPSPQLSQTIPVFNKPSPVFVPPVSSSARPLPIPPPFSETNFNFPSLPAFTKPASMALGISPRLLSPVAGQTAALSAQSTLESVQSDNLFGDRGNTEAWVPSTQDTEYSSTFGFQQAAFSQQNALDDDDSWPVDAKSAQGVHWPFSGFSKEDSMTWSTHASQSHDTVLHSKGPGGHEETRSPEVKDTQLAHGELVEDRDINRKGYDTAGQKSELDELIVSQTAPPESKTDHGLSSSATTAPSHSQAEFFGQASKFIGSTGKKKVIQFASVITKKQPQEDGQKAARLKEMENRRQIAMQRKAEEERARQQEQERKVKDDIERRKRDRDEQGEKKPHKSAATGVSLKKDEEVTKKRKLEQDRPEKKQELKKQISFNKSGFRPTASKQVNALSSSTAYNTSLSQSTASTSIHKLNEKPSRTQTATSTKDKTKSSLKTPVDEELVQPSQIIQTQMSARAKAAMQTEPLVPSENIELPEVNSEYSDSDDEGRARTFDPPGWAQSPELRQALEAQSTINPDDIFGEIRPLRMEELFKAKASRFRPRSSSANWSGSDRLTLEEEREYARRMGFK